MGRPPPHQARSGHISRRYRIDVAFRGGRVTGRPFASDRRRRRGPGIPAGWSAADGPAKRPGGLLHGAELELRRRRLLPKKAPTARPGFRAGQRRGPSVPRSILRRGDQHRCLALLSPSSPFSRGSGARAAPGRPFPVRRCPPTPGHRQVERGPGRRPHAAHVEKVIKEEAARAVEKNVPQLLEVMSRVTPAFFVDNLSGGSAADCRPERSLTGCTASPTVEAANGGYLIVVVASTPSDYTS